MLRAYVVVFYFAQFEVILGLTGYYTSSFNPNRFEYSVENITIQQLGLPFDTPDYFGLYPPYSLRDNYFSILWSGNISANSSGVYTLKYFADDVLFISIDGNLVVASPEVVTEFKEGVPFALDEKNHTIEMRYTQTVIDHYVRIQSNSTNCCFFNGGLNAEVFYFDPFPSYELSRNDLFISWSIGDFPDYSAAKWKGIISTPPHFLNKTVHFRATNGIRVEFNDQIIFDSSFHSFQGTDFVFFLNETQYNVTVSFIKLWGVIYDSVSLSWGLEKGSLFPFPVSDELIVDSHTILNGDTAIENLILTEHATLLINGNLLVFNESSVSGKLIVNGSLHINHGLVIFLPKDFNNTTPIIQTNSLSSQTGPITITIRNTLPLSDTPFQIISFNSSSTNFKFQFPRDYHDNSWNCKGNQFAYSSHTNNTGIFIIKTTSGSECGIGVNLVGALFGIILCG